MSAAEAREEFSLAEYDETIRLVLDSGGEFVLYPKGTSMLPLIVQKRDSVTLAKPLSSPKRGDIAFYLRDNGQYILHRIIRCDDGKFTMCGDNQLTPEAGIELRQIIGIAVKINRNGKFVQDKLGYKLYDRIWRSFFIRRVYFKLRKILKK